jgi:hypothetical protein
MTEQRSGTSDPRLWRVRRRGDWIDAALEPRGDVWRLRFTRKGRLLVETPFATRREALDTARTRLRELERAGWTEHW